MWPNNKLLFFVVILFIIYCFKLSYCTTIRNISGGNINLVCPEIEKQALLSFKESLEDPFNILSTWNISANVTCCNWKGVVCTNITGGGHVQELRLQGLRGKTNPSLVNLKHLRYLDLSQNEFVERVPSFIGSITSLEYLDLSNAGFIGIIPDSIGNLSNLRTLRFENGLYVENLDWLSGLSQLEHLNMNSVDLSSASSWQQVISTLPSLVELHFSSCNLDFNSAHMNNMTTSLVVLDLSHNIFRSFDILKRTFQLSNLGFLDLSDNLFEGPIPTVTNHTTKLQYIDLSSNLLNSTIPDSFYSLKHLEYVYMNNNNLQGPISFEIANLTSLAVLDLSSNQLSENIPGGVAHLCNIQNLDLSQNNLEGEIFGNMSDCFLASLESLDLSENQLSGNLTAQFGEFKSLKTLSLGSNNLSGEIPTNIGKLSFLETLNLTDNNLSGNLPESVGQLFNLEYLDIEDNKLEGVVSEIHFADLTKLKYLYASGNHLTLKVSTNWIPPFKLQILTLGSWNFGEGAQFFPAWLETQKRHIGMLSLSNTGISGNVPAWIWKIGHLNLSHNHLHGNILVISEHAALYQCIYLSSNRFSGPLPQIPPNAFDLDLSDNSFSGELSHFLCNVTTNATYSLQLLHLQGNKLSGEIPDCWTKWSSLTYLNLGNNALSGRLPESIGFLTRLRSLNLYNNKISGRIPFSMSFCTDLVKIDLGDNDIDGGIPTWMGTSLTNLWILILRANRLSGNISSEICQLNSLQILDLSDNNFSGIVPRCVHNFTAMATKIILSGYSNRSYNSTNFRESATVSTKGTEYQYDTTLALVTNIDLSNNNLSGGIPEELTSLVELKFLNLSGNSFTGLIPQSIGDMKQLESLDLSRNSLSGEMPNSFRVMSFLNYLNVSYNHLRGKIPESTQFMGFKASSFSGNDDLCGPPLTSNCTSSGGPLKKEDNHESGDKSSSKIEWLYVFVSLGYAVGLSVFCTTLVLKKSWREAYYEFVEEMWNKFYVYFYIKWRKLTKTSV
ncbi:hypothetical protein ACP275_14G232000 [Erythranthe tilingii]